MNRPTKVRGAISVALKVALIAAALTLVAGASQADRGGRGPARGGGRMVVARGGGAHFARGARFVGGPRFVHAGPRYFYRGGVRVFAPYRRYYYRPHGFVSFDFALGAPYYYYPPVYRAYVAPYPVVVEPGVSIEVGNYPPGFCY